MPVKSLMELAAMACIKNIRSLEGIGDYLPYQSIRQILLKDDNASQLRQIEVNSPQLQGETGEIWIKIIEKDFPLEYKANAYKPPTPDKWYRVWEKYKREHDEALQESESQLKTALASLKKDKEKNTSKIVERKFLPRAGRVGPKRAVGPRDHSSNTLTFNLGSRTKTNTGASIMRKVRREVKEIATIHGALSRPVRPGTGASDLKRAPAAMIGEHRRAAQPQFRTSAQPSAIEQYEKRATVISDCESDVDDNGEDFFGEAVKKKKPAVLRAASPSKPAAKAQPQPEASTKAATQKHEDASTAKSMAGRGSATLANKFGQRSANRPRATASSSADKASPESATHVEDATTSEPDSYLPTTKTVQDGAVSPKSPEEVIGSLSPPAAHAALPRKRKTVDIFMRPKKKRVN